MKAFWDHAWANPRTTASGICSFAMMTGLFVAGSFALHQDPKSMKIAAAATLVAGLAKLYNSALQADPKK